MGKRRESLGRNRELPDITWWRENVCDARTEEFIVGQLVGFQCILPSGYLEESL